MLKYLIDNDSVKVESTFFDVLN